jgi:hypothetical protein
VCFRAHLASCDSRRIRLAQCSLRLGNSSEDRAHLVEILHLQTQAAVWHTACSFLTELKKRIFIPTILLVILVVLLLGALPVYPYSMGWGYYPSGGVGLLLAVLLVVALLRGA